MKNKTFPYERYENTLAWRVIDEAIDDLVQNNDLIEQTSRRYIVGYLAQQLHEGNLLSEYAVSREGPPEA